MNNKKSLDQSRLRHSQVKVKDANIHVIEGGSPTNPVVLFLHGYPQSWLAFEKIMTIASQKAHVMAIDLPGIGESKVSTPHGDTATIVSYVHALIQAKGLQNITLVGHDMGGMVVYSYLTCYGDELKRAVIMDTVVPGIEPWDEVLRNPYIWHFAFHSIPDLPEKLVQGKQADYFDFFFNIISAHPEAISKEARRLYSEAYSDPVALSTGFDWYRGFAQDAKVNAEFARKGKQIQTPVLYLRGKRESGDIQQYIVGFQKAGLQKVESGIIPDSGHFAPEEQPEKVWELIASFMRLE